MNKKDIVMGAIISAGVVISAGSTIYVCDKIAQDYQRKQEAFEKSVDWYVDDVNIPETEKRFLDSLEELKSNPGIDTAEVAQRASMLNLYAIIHESKSKEMPRPFIPYSVNPLINSSLSEFVTHADMCLEELTLVKEHDEYIAHYTSLVEWRKKLASIFSQYGSGSNEATYFLNESVKTFEGKEYQKKMAELNRIWKEKYETPERLINRETFIAHREAILDAFRELRNTFPHKMLISKAEHVSKTYKASVHQYLQNIN